MPATLRDVAAAAGVHPGTASRAMNPDTQHLVNSVTARRVLKAADALGYVPNPMARSLKTNRSQSLGVVIPDISNPLFPPMIRGFEDVVAAEGYNVLVANTDNDEDRERQQIAALRARHVEGFVVATALLHHTDLAPLIAGNLPVVLINRVDPELPASSIAGDDESGIRQAVQHLRLLGHRRIAHIAGPQSTSTGVARFRAFRHEMQDQGLEYDDLFVKVADHYHAADGAQALTELLDANGDFTAIIAANDLLALGCYDTMRERGLRCPQDISVVGFNDMLFVDRVHPPLTTVHVPQYELGAEAGRNMLAQLRNNEKKPVSVLLPVHLVIRESTTAPSA